MKRNVIVCISIIALLILSACGENNAFHLEDSEIEMPDLSEIADIPIVADVELESTSEKYKELLENDAPPSVCYDPVELAEITAEYAREQETDNTSKVDAASPNLPAQPQAGVGLTDSERMWLARSHSVATEDEVIAFKKMPKQSDARVDMYYVYFYRAEAEMNNYLYDCAKSIYDSNPAAYTYTSSRDHRGAYIHVVNADGKDITVLTESWIDVNAECFDMAQAMTIEQYGAEFPADYLRSIGIK